MMVAVTECNSISCGEYFCCQRGVQQGADFANTVSFNLRLKITVNRLYAIDIFMVV